jgi:hypothetical protein
MVLATLGRSQDVCRRNPGYPSKANGSWLVVDHFLRGLGLIKREIPKPAAADPYGVSPACFRIQR